VSSISVYILAMLFFRLLLMSVHALIEYYYETERLSSIFFVSKAIIFLTAFPAHGRNILLQGKEVGKHARTLNEP